jgi:hypothetical protein
VDRLWYRPTRSRTQRSLLASHLPSREYATNQIPSPEARKIPCGSPVTVFHKRVVPSALPETSVLRSGAKASDNVAALCPEIGTRRLP